MSEATDQIIGQLAPERVMPAELAAAEDVVVVVERVEIGARLVDGADGTLHVRGDVVRDARPNESRTGNGDELVDREAAVGEGRMRVTVDRLPRRWCRRAHRGRVTAWLPPRPAAARARCRAESGSCRAGAPGGRRANRARGPSRARAA